MASEIAGTAALRDGRRGREACRRRCGSSCAPRPAARRSCSPRRVAALVWVNVDASSYDSLWETTLSIDLGGAGIVARPARVGEQRPDDVLLLRRRARGAARVRPRRAAGAAAVRAAAARRDRRDGGGRSRIYLAFNAGRSSAHGWGIAMSTDTAFALGLLALVGPRFPDRLRAFMLTVVVVDDIARARRHRHRLHARRSTVAALLVAVGLFGVVLVARALRRPRSGSSTSLLGAATWVALLESGVEPVVVGLAMGLLAYAYPAARSDLERATERFREFREQPTPELARSAGVGLRSAISPNERLQQLYHPWTSYVIVPLFALANAGIAIDGDFLARAFTSPITLGILVGYVVGKPVGHPRRLLAADAAEPRPAPAAGRLGGGRRRRHDRRDRLHRRAAGRHARVRRAAARGGEARHPRARRSARRSSPGCCSAPRRCCRGGCGSARCSARAEPLVDLDDRRRPRARPHPRARSTRRSRSSSTATSSARTAGRPSRSSASCSRDFGDVRYVWRHLPLNDVHPHAQLAAEAAEAAADQGAFWEMHDLLLDHQDALRPSDLVGYAEQLGLDVERFTRRPARARRRRPGRRGRRQRRPERRLRHADLLHQRPPPLRRLRHRHALGRRPRSRRAGDPDDHDQRLSSSGSAPCCMDSCAVGSAR